MITIMYILLALLSLKSIYNLTIPYSLLAKMRRNEEGGISFMPYVDLGIIALMLLGALASIAITSLPNVFSILGVGLGVVALSYLHLFIVMIIGGSVISKRRSKE